MQLETIVNQVMIYKLFSANKWSDGRKGTKELQRIQTILAEC